MMDLSKTNVLKVMIIGNRFSNKGHMMRNIFLHVISLTLNFSCSFFVHTVSSYERNVSIMLILVFVFGFQKIYTKIDT